MPVVSSQSIRMTILRQSRRAHVGHIGSSLSIADIGAALFSDVLNIESPEDPDRDRFVLSKGHAVLALYAALHELGLISAEDLDTFCGDGTQLSMHPEVSLRGIDFSTGSLGQGLSMGAGAALAARLQKSRRMTYVLMSDAELNEGSVWEAALFAAHHKLANLTVIVDANGQQALGKTVDVMNTGPMLEKWLAFGWDAHEMDGHDVEGIAAIIGSLDRSNSKPKILIARTTFGKGVDFMEGQIKWHYWPMSEDEFVAARSQVQEAEL